MLMLVAYDVSTEAPGGKRRLRRVARACLDWGQRVQNSVFECEVDPAQWAELRRRLLGEIDPATDSLRFYPVLWRKRHERSPYGMNGMNGVSDRAAALPSGRR